MWGFYNSRDRILSNKMLELLTSTSISSYYNADMKSPKGHDQDFLSYYFYPLIKKKSIIHDSYLCHKPNFNGQPFPTRRKGNCFINNPSDCNAFNTSLTSFFICPVMCRPHDHQDWIFC